MYTQLSRQRVFCSQCDNYPEGFHGGHELRRHVDRVHTTVRKVWVCKDISPDQKFLANCKACRNGKKYVANYNAAAHLRRAHFRPSKTNDERGGKEGGGHPPMEELERWMYQIEERIPASALPGWDYSASDSEYEQELEDPVAEQRRTLDQLVAANMQSAYQQTASTVSQSPEFSSTSESLGTAAATGTATGSHSLPESVDVNEAWGSPLLTVRDALKYQPRDHASRSHEYYFAKPERDGLYHCPWKERENCSHTPTKIKRTYE